MTYDERGWERFHEFYSNVLRPLMKRMGHRAVCDRMIEEMKVERNPTFRMDMQAFLVTELLALRTEEGNAEAFHWARHHVVEFEDEPFAWTHLGFTLVSGPHDRAPTPEEIAEGLQHYQTAVDKARARDEWVRFVLFDVIRALMKVEDYVGVEHRMREVLDDLTNKRLSDIPAVEREWVKRIPEGAVDPLLLERWDQLSKASYRRWRRLGEERLSVPTLADLEAEP